VLVEACVDSVESAVAAEQGGAARLELCAQLDVGGTTPSAELVTAVKKAVRIPVFVMIRPRGGSFVYTAAETDQMRKSIDAALNLGADGLVIGALNEMGDVNRALTRELVERSSFHPVTFHRAFDEARSQATALEALVEAGVDRVLTGGGPGPAVEGVDLLRDLVYEALGRITIMAGGKVRADNARSIIEQTGVAELHARCDADPSRISGIVAAVRN
jgi:copper homeostasis protein